MSKAEYRAAPLRGEALNRMYGHDVKSAKPAGMSAAEYRALWLRSQALNKKYGLGSQNASSVAAGAASSPSAFAWSAFGIGAAAMLGFVLLTAGVIGEKAPMIARPCVRTS